MAKRYVVLWFRYLVTDWFTLRQPHLRGQPFVLSTPSQGRIVITAANALAEQEGIFINMAVADARAILPSLQVIDDQPALTRSLLQRMAEWCIRFTPFVAIDPQGDGLIFDATGCSHLWGGDETYLHTITQRFNEYGYSLRTGMADTIGCAWAIARFGRNKNIIAPAEQSIVLPSLPPIALRLETDIIERLHKLGLRQVSQFIQMPRSALRRRFGNSLLLRLDQALGHAEEILEPVQLPATYAERLPCLEPISTATGISIALERLLSALCQRLQQEQKGLRNAIFKCYRIDGKMITLTIGTNRPSHHAAHLFKLFEIKIDTIEPALGIELFVLEAPIVEDHLPAQEKLWEDSCGLQHTQLAELLDRVAGKLGNSVIHRFLPDEHYWPERSIKVAATLNEQPSTEWKTEKPRPLQLLSTPQPVQVTAPIPDYPPMLFRYENKLHKIIKADGPERIEQEWWIQEGQHRDYYAVEDEDGNRYWLFRAGHYDPVRKTQWFIHGFFA